MRHVVYSAWRVFYSCLVMGAWSCLSQDMDLKGTPRFLCADGVVSNNRRKGERICDILLLLCLFFLFYLYLEI